MKKHEHEFNISKPYAKHEITQIHEKDKNYGLIILVIGFFTFIIGSIEFFFIGELFPIVFALIGISLMAYSTFFFISNLSTMLTIKKEI